MYINRYKIFVRELNTCFITMFAVVLLKSLIFLRQKCLDYMYNEVKSYKIKKRIFIVSLYWSGKAKYSKFDGCK